MKLIELFKKKAAYLSSGHLVKHGPWITLQYVVNIGMVFLFSVFVSRYLSIEDYGEYKYILSIFAIFSLATLSGMDAVVMRGIARGDREIFIKTFLFKIRYGLLGSLACLSFSGYQFYNGNIELGYTYLLLSLLVPFFESTTLFIEALQGASRFDIASKYSSAASFVQYSVLIVAVYLRFDMIWLVVLPTAAMAASRLALIYRTKKYLDTHREHKDDDPDKEVKRYGVGMTVVKVINQFAGQVQVIALYKIVGSAALGIFAFVSAPVDLIRGFVIALTNSFFPVVAQDNWQLPKLSAFIKKISPSMLLLTLAAVTYYFICPFLFWILYPKYYPYAYLSGIMMLTLPLSGYVGALLTIAVSKKNLKLQAIVSVTDFVGFLIFGLTAAYLYGLNGYVGGIVVFKIVQAIIITVLLFGFEKEMSSFIMLNEKGR